MKSWHLVVRVLFICALLQLSAVADDAVEDAVVAPRTMSVEAVKRSAKQGDAEAEAELGERYATGRDVPQDFQRAALWRERAAKHGVARAQNALGKQYAAGLGVPKNNEKALAWLRRAADHEDSDFWFDLAIFYEQVGDEDALDAAVIWHRRGVDAGHVGAHAHLGLMYYNGEGVPRDLNLAAELLVYAAEHGNARAQNNLGLIVTQGQGIEQDYEKAVTLFQSAADQGLKEAYTNLGVMYENGFGVDFDEAKAVELYRLARLQGSIDGALAQIGFPADPRIVIDIATPDDMQRMTQEAALGDAIAQYQSGYLLLGSSATAANYAAAAELLEKAAANGISAAMTNLGLLYFRGLGVPQDYVLGFMWVSLGASSGRNELIGTRDSLVSFLTATQINDAQRMARQYRAGKGAGDR